MELWSIKSVEGRLKHTNEVVQLMAKAIDSTIQFAAENADNIQRLERNLIESTGRSDAKWFWSKAAAHLGDLRRLARSYMRIVLQSSHHLLLHEIMEFIDLPMAWEEFMEQLQAGDWEPAFGNWANIFQQKSDFWYGDGVLKLVVEAAHGEDDAIQVAAAANDE
jgi:hypothetical protein